MFYIGCHLSAAKGFTAMGKAALKIGADTFQFFTRNPPRRQPPRAAQFAVLFGNAGRRERFPRVFRT